MNLSEARLGDLASVGGKGANLGELLSAGIRVPGGFVVTTDVYRDFLRENGLDKALSRGLAEAGEDEARLVAFAGELRRRIREGRFPAEAASEIRARYRELGESARVAVRSSATAEDLPDSSFAGQQETYLNVRGERALLERVRDCYASLWSDRAVCYRAHRGCGSEGVAIAVVVQEMVESEKSGVLFTANPVSRSAEEVQINAAYGLGESVVSGRVNADSIVSDREGRILERHVGDKATQILYADSAAAAGLLADGDAGDGKEPGETVEVPVSEELRRKTVLSDEEARELVELGLRIERLYGKPMDIEWAWKDGVFTILQARPITTLNGAEDAAEVERYLRGMRMTRGLREVMRFQLEKMPFAYRAFDFDLINLITEQKPRIFAEGGIRINGDMAIDDDGIQTIPAPKKGITWRIYRLPGFLLSLMDFDACERACEGFMKRYGEELEGIKGLSFETMGSAECGAFLRRSRALLRDIAYDRFRYALFPSVLNGPRFTRLIRKANPEYSAFDFYRGLDNRTAVVARDIMRMARELKRNPRIREAISEGESFEDLCGRFGEFRELSEEFLEKNGYKSDYNCYCADARTFLEEPDRLAQILRPLMGGGDTGETSETSEADDEKRAEYERILAALKKKTGRRFPKIKRRIEQYRAFHVVREETQYMWERLFFYVRKCLRRINFLLLGDERYLEGVANLFYEELVQAAERGALREADRERIRRRNELHPLAERVWDACKYLVFDARGDVLRGVGGSPGRAAGRVCVISGPGEFHKLKKGDVLVCHLTDPEWTPLFQLASAVVADTGSALSHAAIVAREFRIPAVLGVGFATEAFKDGDLIQVDGEKGEVRKA